MGGSVTLRLHKLECRAIVGVYDEQGRLVNEETSAQTQSVYQLEQLASYWEALEREVEQRNERETSSERSAISSDD